MHKIIFLLFFLPGLASAQWLKLGDMSIADSVAKKYLLDCYLRPDTIRYYDIHKENSSHDEYAKEIAYVDKLDKICRERIKLQSRQKKWEPMDNNGHYAWVYIWDPTWIVIRKPSKRDFIKWFNENRH